MTFILVTRNLKKANVAQEFTQEQILEFMLVEQDPVYFAKTSCKDCFS